MGKECVVSEMRTLDSTLGVHDDQFTLKCSSLLEHVNSVLKNSQVSDDVYRIDLDNAHDSLNILCGKSIAISFVYRDNVYENIFVCECGSDILGEGRASLGLGPWLIFPFDPGTLLECGNLYTPHLMLGQDDKQCLVVGANEGRQSSSLSLFVDDDHFLCVFCTKLFMFNTKDPLIYSKFVHPPPLGMKYDVCILLTLTPHILRMCACCLLLILRGTDSRSNPFQEGEDDTSTTTRMDVNECVMNPSKEVHK